VLDFVPDVGSSDIVVKALGVIFNHDFALTLAFVLAFYELFLKIVVGEGLYEGTELFLLVVSG